MADPYNAAATLDVDGTSYRIYALDALGDVDSLPYSIKVLLESCLRNCDEHVVTRGARLDGRPWNRFISTGKGLNRPEMRPQSALDNWTSEIPGDCQFPIANFRLNCGHSRSAKLRSSEQDFRMSGGQNLRQSIS